MINSDATDNFIIKDYTEKRKYLIKEKTNLYKLINLNNISLENN